MQVPPVPVAELLLPILIIPSVALILTHLIGIPFSNDRFTVVSVVDVVEPRGVNVIVEDVVVLE